MKLEIIQKCQDGFFWLTDWKERVLKKFFSLPWVAPVFKYITPNDLCYLRILAAIIILFLYLQGYYGWLFPIFVIAVLFDFIDGPLARSTNRQTEEGKNLDPIADKVLISIPLFVIGIEKFGHQTILMFLLVEVLLVLTANYLKPYLREKFSIPLTSGANAFGQIKMSAQAVAVGVILYNPNQQTLLTIGEWLIWIGIGFGIASFLRHLARMDNPVEPRKRIITVPNLITLSGIFLFIPVGFALAREQWWLAGSIIAWIFVSDALDGWIARRYDQVTAFGAAIDPLRDFLARTFFTVWIFIWMSDPLARAVIVSIVIVEVAAGLINVITAKKCKTVSLVNSWGKLKAFVHYIAMGAILLHHFEAFVMPSHIVIGLFFTMFVFSLVALISYVDQRRQLIIRQKTDGSLV